MGIFDDVVINAKTAASAVGKKAEQIVDLSKLKYAAAGLNNEFSKKKEALGSYIFESYKTGKLDQNKVTEKINELKELEQNLIATKEMISEAKNKKICKECGFENEKESTFCNKCGEKLISKETAAEDINSNKINENEEEDITVAVSQKAKDLKSDVEEKVVEFTSKAADKAENLIDTVEENVEKAADKVKEKTEDFADATKEKLDDLK